MIVNLRDRKFFAGKDDVDALFARLEVLDEDHEALGAQQDDLIKTCDKIRRLVGNKSPMIAFATTAVKMEIFSRLGQDKKIQSEYSNLVLVCGLPKSVNERQKNYVDYSAISSSKFLCRKLFWTMPKALEIRTGGSKEEISVPDVLAGASIVCGENHSHHRIREVFHELWQIENLQPLLTIAACATFGKRCNYKGEISDKLPLQIIFSDKFIRDSGITGISGGNDVVIICLGDNTKNKNAIYYSNASLRATVAHELHHFWEKVFYDSSALPYPENPLPQKSAKNQIVSDPNLERKDQLNKMLQEAAEIKDEFHVKILTQIYDDHSHKKNSEPFQTFRNLSNYQDDLPTKHIEIVVRVSDALAGMVGEGGCDEVKAFELMNLSGLTECIKFFHEERDCMRQAITKLQPPFRTTSTLDESREIPPYAIYGDTLFHQAVRNEDLGTLRTCLKSFLGLLPLPLWERAG